MLTYYLENDAGILMPHVLETPSSFINTQDFRREALYFLKHGKYPCGEPGTHEYREYWLAQENYCINGYTSGGVRITGDHYFYLNFCQIKLTNAESDIGVSKTKRI